MNASYKIVLLAAFVLFAAVVGYYILDGSGEESPAEEPAEGQLADNQSTPPAESREIDPADNPRTPPTRPGLDRLSQPEPAEDPPSVTIGAPPGDEPAPESPRRGPDPDAIALAETPTTGVGPDRPGPGVESTTSDPSESTAETPGGTEDPNSIAAEGPSEDPSTPTDIAETPESERVTERPAPAERATPNTRRSYTVKPGDTFASIALEAYGEERYWFEIAQANPSVDPKRLQVDQVIVLPNLSETDRDRDEPTPPAPGQDRRYTVKPGDVLSIIAERFYGDSEAWDLIYNRNRDKIGSNPDRLQAGMVLIIPQPYNGAE